MSYEFNDELISAYLDGELTAEEQALVERKLNESPEHQQMLGELSALRDSFQTLSSYTLDERFGERVLRAAERRMLAGDNYAETAAVGSALNDDAPTPASVVPENRQAWRLAVGSVAAVAALLLITLFLANRGNEQGANRNVASQDSSEEQEDEIAASDKSAGDEKPLESRREDDESDTDESDTDQQIVASGAPVDRSNSLGGGSSAAPQVPKNQVVQEKMPAQPKPARFPSESNESKSLSPAAPQQPEQESFGTAADTPEALGRSQIAGGRGNRVPEDESADGSKLGNISGNQNDGFDFVVFVDVPKDQFAARPVEEALRNSNVTEDTAARRYRGVNRAASDESRQAELATRTPNVASGLQRKKEPAEDKADDLERASDSAPASNELLVVATLGQIEMVCADLRNKGLTATPIAREMSTNGAESLRMLKQTQVRPGVQAASDDDAVERKAENLSELAKNKQEESDRKHSLGPPPAANARKIAASKATPPRPAPAAEVHAPGKSNKDQAEPQSGAIAPADVRETPKHRRARTAQDANEGGKPKHDATGSRDAASGQIATTEKAAEQGLGNRPEKLRADEAGGSFYRRLERVDQLADRKESAAQPDASSFGSAAQQQRDSNAAAALNSQNFADAAVDYFALDVPRDKVDPSTRVQVRFVIRTIDPSPASTSAAEESKPK